MLTGIKIYEKSLDLPPSELEIRIVIYGVDNKKSRQWVRSNILPIVDGGRFLETAHNFILSPEGGMTWSDLQNDFVKNDLPTLKGKKQSIFKKLSKPIMDLFKKPSTRIESSTIPLNRCGQSI